MASTSTSKGISFSRSSARSARMSMSIRPALLLVDSSSSSRRPRRRMSGPAVGPAVNSTSTLPRATSSQHHRSGRRRTTPSSSTSGQPAGPRAAVAQRRPDQPPAGPAPVPALRSAGGRRPGEVTSRTYGAPPMASVSSSRCDSSCETAATASIGTPPTASSGRSTTTRTTRRRPAACTATSSSTSPAAPAASLARGRARRPPPPCRLLAPDLPMSEPASRPSVDQRTRDLAGTWKVTRACNHPGRDPPPRSPRSVRAPRVPRRRPHGPPRPGTRRVRGRRRARSLGAVRRRDRPVGGVLGGRRRPRAGPCRGGRPGRRGGHVSRRSTTATPACSATWPPTTGRASRPWRRRLPASPPRRRRALLGAPRLASAVRAEWDAAGAALGDALHASPSIAALLARVAAQRGAHADCWRGRPARRHRVRSSPQPPRLPQPPTRRHPRPPPGQPCSPQELATPSSR